MVKAARSAWCVPEFRGVVSTIVLLLFSATLCPRQEGWSVLDSLCFAVCTGLTVGFGDLTPPTDPGDCPRAGPGQFTGSPDPAKTPLRLVGCDPAEPLLAWRRGPRRRERRWAQLRALDRHGRVMRRHDVGLEVAGVARPYSAAAP